ncbi:hypothetical protein NHX12_018339 [Muraenolepis orangiensis]|uniref:Ig-like domain-containing protein n=1 Tax=Muraenolepis orangiensis TaxID=630683 RepID=A0A9Q0IXG6_9TELE|nr:hypothetical protein NHX12_018339 [Muraenolepis orangiensis]
MGLFPPESGGPFSICPASIMMAVDSVYLPGVSPAFISPPTHQAVTEGNTALFTCQASGAPKPAIVWRKGPTLISVPPSDQRVIKGTTATLDCNAQHDPRVTVRYCSAHWDPNY